MTPTTKGGHEAKTEGRSRTGQGEVRAGQETVGVVIVVIRNGTEVATQGKEVTDGVIVLSADLLRGVMTAVPDATEGSMKAATTNRERVPGKLRVDSDHFSGPHWPPEGTGSIADKDRLLRQLR